MKKSRCFSIIALFCISQLISSVCYSTPLDASNGDLKPKNNIDLEVNESTFKLESLDDVFFAFTQGLSPDLDDSMQAQAFEVYRCMKFGASDYPVTPSMIHEIAKILKNYPSLDKEFFRNYQIVAHRAGTPVTAELKTFSNTQLRRISEVVRDLYQIDSNPKLWKKILQYESGQKSNPESELDTKPESKAESKKDAKKRGLDEWNAFLAAKLPADLKERLSDPLISFKERAKELFAFLSSERKVLHLARKDLVPISRALIDLIHTVGYQDTEIQAQFKSDNGLARIEAFRKVLEMRDDFARELGFESGYRGAVREFCGLAPTGIANENEYLNSLNKFEQGVYVAGELEHHSTPIKKVRHLSLEESPLRSCLGGDCATRTYMAKALDPNFHYYTLTDEDGISSGHITIVLGMSKQNGRFIRAAFIDKIQNVPLSDMAPMIEGIRLSVLEKGYLLVMPDDLGNHNGLSNADVTRDFVKNKIPLDHELIRHLVSFSPHPNNFTFRNEYSRAYGFPPCSPVLPLVKDHVVQLVPAELSHRWKTPVLDIKKLAASAVNLKFSAKLAMRLRYIPTQEAISFLQLKVDPEFRSVLEHWISDRDEPIQLRKQALIHLWTKRIPARTSLFGLLGNFSISEQIQIIQNFLDATQYRYRFIEEKEEMPQYLSRFRGNQKLKQIFYNLWLPGSSSDWFIPLFDIILKGENISESKISQIIDSVYKLGYQGNDFNFMSEIMKTVDGTSLERPIQTYLFTYFLKNLTSESSLARVLAKCLTGEGEIEYKWAEFLLSPENRALSERFLVGRVFEEILRFKETHPEFIKFNQAAMHWLGSSEVALEKKAIFLLSNIGSVNGCYQLFKNEIPHEQMSQIKILIDQKSFIGVFEKALESYGTDARTTVADEFFGRSPIESFEFVPISVPKGGKKVWIGSPDSEEGRVVGEELREVTLARSFEVQKTPVTSLQWKIVMGNGSLLDFFVPNLEPGLDGSEPKDNVSYVDIEVFIQRLNRLQKDYVYSLPSEAEWEFVARAGSATSYFFGESVNDLHSFAWFGENSGGHLHPVARLKPNPLGLFDIYGNVYQLTRTHWYPLPSLYSVTDHREIQGASYFGIFTGNVYTDPFVTMRGCAYFSTWLRARSANRGYLEENKGSAGIGFRLVRFPVLN